MLAMSQSYMEGDGRWIKGMVQMKENYSAVALKNVFHGGILSFECQRVGIWEQQQPLDYMPALVMPPLCCFK